MPLLLYCVAPASAVDTTVRGVCDAEVRSQELSGLRFFFSEVTSEVCSSHDVATAARQVHEVVSDIFSRAAVLPFRYPTVMNDDAELARLAGERGAAFHEFLERVGLNVQMDIRLTLAMAEPAEPASSGRAYLEGRSGCQAQLSTAAESCRQAAHSAEWRIQQRGENIRCQALISRVEVLSFFERMRALKLPDGVKAAVSGPWPPAGFWEDEPR
jgi:Gas vesicle synthesis protein GvpL/GvpF